MKITILGCGPSYGIPSVAFGFGNCDPNEPKNIRTRSSILLQEKWTTLLFDTSPDLRQQLYAAKVQHVDGVLWTHIHADHTAGIDDLRALACIREKEEGKGVALDGYLADWDKEEFYKRFGYCTQPKWDGLPLLNMHTLLPGKMQKIRDLNVMPMEQEHGSIKSLGFRVGDFAYNTDFNSLSDEAFELLKGIRVWVVSCIALSKGGNKHLGLFEILDLIEQIKPEQAYLTHMGMSMDYNQITPHLPESVHMAYDGLTIEM